MSNNMYIQWIGFYTLMSREVRRIIRIWPQTLLPPIITMLLYFVIFGNLMGQRIGAMNQLPYISFITPGLVMMSIINNSYLNVCSSFFTAKFQNCIEELLVAPMANHTIILGYVCGGTFRGLATGTLVLGIAAFFTKIHIESFSLTLILASLTAILFSLAGLVNGIFAKKFDDIAIVPMFVLTPLTYLGGVFYSTSLLPSFWQKVSMVNPILYIVNGFRYAIFGTADVTITLALIILTSSVVFLYLLAWYLMQQGIGLRR